MEIDTMVMAVVTILSVIAAGLISIYNKEIKIYFSKSYKSIKTKDKKYYLLYAFIILSIIVGLNSIIKTEKSHLIIVKQGESKNFRSLIILYEKDNFVENFCRLSIKDKNTNTTHTAITSPIKSYTLPSGKYTMSSTRIKEIDSCRITIKYNPT